MKLTAEDVCILAKKLRVSITDEEAEAFAADLSALETLSEALLAFSEPGTSIPMACPLTALREDVVGKSLSHDEVFFNTAARRGSFFSVPRVVGEEEA